MERRSSKRGRSAGIASTLASVGAIAYGYWSIERLGKKDTLEGDLCKVKIELLEIKERTEEEEKLLGDTHELLGRSEELFWNDGLRGFLKPMNPFSKDFKKFAEDCEKIFTRHKQLKIKRVKEG